MPTRSRCAAATRFVVSSTCGERSFIGTYAVAVHDDEECYPISRFEPLSP